MLAATVVDGRVEVREHPDPVPGRGQVRVRVRAAGLNGADLHQVAGHYPAPPGSPADIPGLELAGEVEALGPGAARFALGDRVMAVVGGGGQAELAVVDEREAMPVPDGIAWEEAGGFPEVFTTAHDALCSQAALATGERLLVSGGAGGVGTAGVQVGLACGARVVASVRSPQLRPDVASLAGTSGGELVVIDPAEVSEHGPYDVVLELVGAPNLPVDLAALATGGRIAVIGTGAGSRAELDLGLLMRARGRLHGSTLRARPPEAKATAARAVEAQVLPHLAAGRLRVPVCASFPLSEAPRAYERFAAGGKLGKVVLVAG
ncbi:MAG: zinc-binding dehydrogenase [Actinomycetota bacterium]|nr:zinc-binding dehydrogenase [Actinomycetota bacterium]